MKNIDIINLVNAGVLAITNHTLSVSDGYKVYKFRKALQNCFTSIQEKEKDMLKEHSIEDPQAFDKRLYELRSIKEPTEEEATELTEKEQKLEAFKGYRNAFYDEDADLNGIVTLPYEEWKKLQDENKEVDINGQKVDVLTGAVEMMLEDVFWKAPEE